MSGWLLRHVQSALFAAGRLARAPVATAFTLLVIAIALTLPSTLALAIQSLSGVTGELSGSVDVSVYFKQDVPLEKARQLANSLKQRSGIARVDLIPADEALKQFREQSGFGAALDVLEGNPLPHALDVRPRADAADPEHMESLRRYLVAWPEVELVQVDSEWVQRLNAILELLRRLVMGTAALLGVGVLAVVGNTIRLEIYNRRAEIEVTKLVGGSNAFVRRPFLYTGLFYGVLGALLAAALVWLALYLLDEPVSRLARTYGSNFQLMLPRLRELGLLVAAGAVLGIVGAWLAAARHLARIEPRS
jgi:cell division transport system permease protein